MTAISKERLIASVCRDSFYEFLLRFWDSVIPEPIIVNWHMQVICDEMQIIAERVFENKPTEYDLLINVSPGTTKSTICSEMFPAWVWTRAPHLQMICGSYAMPLAMDLSRRSRNIVKSDLYRKCFPEILLCEDQNVKTHFANTRGGSRYTTSVGGSVTGMHGHLLVIDDPLDPVSAVSEQELNTANRWMSQTLPTRKINKDVAPTILIQQRLAENDPAGMWIEQSKRTRPIKHICLPAELTADVKPEELREMYTDGLMDPVRLSRSVLSKMREELGDAGYAGQFLQKPVPEGGMMFNIKNLQIVPTVPSPIIQSVRYWDKAGSSGKGCFTVGTRMNVLYDKRFLIDDVVRGQWEYSKREKIIRQTAERDGRKVVQIVEQEPGSGGKESAEATIRSLAGYVCKADRPSGDKVLRAEPFAIQVNGGNVLLLQGTWNSEFVHELEFFPHSKYKDQVDSASGSFAHLAKGRRVVGGLT